ncbi:protease [Pedobacter sp. HMWF019]|uniref:protease n=1 Tax=Pedobacter sp. HMWF019 TaxID=2056856 RepID=UPI000D34B0C4|nr:protease [Pedobacter sp. HMWF019]PTS96146.1 protease [Pedobacter sp. HMWF019]
MKNFSTLLSATVILALSSCGMNNNVAQNSTGATNSSATVAADSTAGKALFAKMLVKDTIKAGEMVELKFTVYNNADTTQQFCKWHTPFEPFISKYLDVKSESGEEVNYKGAMAKRVMPPPASSYVAVNSKDSVSATVDLLKGYDISKPARYTVIYVGQNMSGLIVKDSISFVYTK